MSYPVRTVAGVDDDDIARWLPGHLEEQHGVRVAGLRRLQDHNPFVHRVELHDGPAWVARVFGPRRSSDRVHGDAEILRLLEARDYPAERCAADEPVSSHGDATVLVTRFVPGRMATSSKRSLRQLGDLLGRLHALDDRTGATLRDAGSWHGDPAHEGLPAEDLAGGLAMLDEVDGLVTPAMRPKVDALREQVATADSCDDLPRSLIHPDPAPVNAIAADSGPVFVDWTGAGSGPRVVSLGLLLSTALRPGGWDEARVDSVVAGYHPHVRLEDAELDRLGAAMRIRALYWPCWTVRAAVRAGYTPTGDERWWPDEAAITAVATHAAELLAAD